MKNNLEKRIEEYYEEKCSNNKEEIIQDIRKVLHMLNIGEIRVLNSEGSLNLWIKKAILLAFKYFENTKQIYDSYDKIELLQYDYSNPKYRKIPGSVIRSGAYIGENAVIMPSYINVGAYIGQKTMIDIGAIIGSCAQIGECCHISAGVCIGGVLEPIVATPVIIEDNCFIGANSAVLEGAIVKKNSTIAAGVIISASTRIIDRETGKVLDKGIIPEGSVVVPGSYVSKNNISINCAIIIKYNELNKSEKTNINKLLRQ
jgi:2,3,4,5-tetrahydropyridine-2-carboxylate N-succinyltransferase